MDEIERSNIDLSSLKEFTAARIVLGRTGVSVPLKKSLEFKLAHAHARDAVYSELNIDGLTEGLQQFETTVLHLHSKAAYREQYLQRPDLGRQLDEHSLELVCDHAGNHPDLAIVIADGLSATAVNHNAIGLLKILMPLLQSANLEISPISLAKQGRVAIADDIGESLGAKLSLILIGERPGLSSADSMGAYLTYNPKPGLTDESRNCISNIRPQGLNLKAAAKKIFYLVQESLKRKLSGVALKDNAGLLNE